MNRFAITCLALFIVILTVASIVSKKHGGTVTISLDEKAWMTDAPAALAKARSEGKTVLLDFTGSDWCTWCQHLDGEIFSTDEFKTFAEKNLVLVKVDFPRSKPQSRELQRQNQELAERYQIQGYPTIIVLDAKGNKVGELGYMEGGPGPWLAELQKISKS